MSTTVTSRPAFCSSARVSATASVNLEFSSSERVTTNLVPSSGFGETIRVIQAGQVIDTGVEKIGA